MRRFLVPFLAVMLTVAPASAASDPQVDMDKQAKDAERVVVATVTDVTSSFGENEFGDRLIYSFVTMRVSETMKGSSEETVVVRIEGGTVGELTLTVSDMPRMTRGERALLFLDHTPNGGHQPHGRGAGVLKLDRENRVAGRSVSLDTVRATVRAAQSGRSR